MMGDRSFPLCWLNPLFLPLWLGSPCTKSTIDFHLDSWTKRQASPLPIRSLGLALGLPTIEQFRVLLAGWLHLQFFNLLTSHMYTCDFTWQMLFRSPVRNFCKKHSSKTKWPSLDNEILQVLNLEFWRTVLEYVTASTLHRWVSSEEERESCGPLSFSLSLQNHCLVLPDARGHWKRNAQSARSFNQSNKLNALKLIRPWAMAPAYPHCQNACSQKLNGVTCWQRKMQHWWNLPQYRGLTVVNGRLSKCSTPALYVLTKSTKVRRPCWIPIAL